MRHTQLLTGLTLGATLLVAAACGSSTAPGGAGGHSVVIDANTNLTFTPSPDTIAAGDTVQFAWHAVPHNVVWDSTPVAVANIGDDDTGFTSGDSSRVLTTPGTYAYHCDIHDGMKGVIVVQ
jgi:plastocyanin